MKWRFEGGRKQPGRQAQEGAVEIAKELRQADLREGLLEWHIAEQGREINEGKKHFKELEQKFDIDPLTEVHSRKFFDDALELALARIDKKVENRHRHEDELIKRLTVAFIDLDHFKEVNDVYGHQEGDIIIKEAAILMKTTFGNKDIVARMGGDEFAVILPDVDTETAASVAERVRMAIESDPKLHKYGVTASIGICQTMPGMPINATTLLGNADKALYAAKDAGRNRVKVYSTQTARKD